MFALKGECERKREKERERERERESGDMSVFLYTLHRYGIGMLLLHTIILPC